MAAAPEKSEVTHRTLSEVDCDSLTEDELDSYITGAEGGPTVPAFAQQDNATGAALRAKAAKVKRERLLERYRGHILGFVSDYLGVYVTPDQQAVLRSFQVNPRTFVRAANGVGKAYLASLAVAWFMACHPEAIVTTTAPARNRSAATRGRAPRLRRCLPRAARAPV